MRDYWYHRKEWLSFWYTNMNDTYGDDFSQWSSPDEMAEIWYEEEYYSEEDPHGNTVGYSAGVFIGSIAS
tara:strand:+ start:556 stop:765 length:210 start_codon:yes stop_codon:yes gene_type:complete